MMFDEKRHEIITNNQDVGVRLFISQENEGFKALHWHHHLEIVLVLEGEVTFRFAKQEVHLKQNEFIAIGSEVLHSSTNTENISLVLQVPVSYLETYWSNCDLLIFNLPHESRETMAPQYQHIVATMRAMTEVYVAKQPGYLLQFTSHLMDVLYTLITTYGIDTAPDKVTHQSRLKALLRYINDHYDEALSVKGLAANFHYHPDYLSRHFKEQSGMSLTRYLYQLRLEHVYHDLIYQEDSMKDVFARHGITNYKMGLKLFKEQYGQTPLQIHKRAQNLPKNQ